MGIFGSKGTVFSTLQILAFLLIWWTLVEAVPVEEDLALTYQEKVALDKFRPRVSSILPHEYMNQEIYLIKWLRARNLNLILAERMLRENLRWRKANRMDTIHEEDWSDMQQMFPYTRDTFDKDNRPIATITFGRWNIRRVILQGKLPRFLRYLDKLLDQVSQDVYRQQFSGLNVTQWKVLYNMEGFNLIQQGCSFCIPSYVSFLRSYELHYPGNADQIIFIRTPPAFHIILNILRPNFSPATRQALRVFGMNRQEWMAYLDREISRDQRRPEFGGTKEDYLTKDIWVHPAQGRPDNRNQINDIIEGNKIVKKQ